MKSVKPGRGPSLMGGIMAVFMALFGIFWIIMAFNMGAGAFSLFGLIFVFVAITVAVFNFKNALGKKRFSSFDITDSTEEQDPLDKNIKDKENENNEKNDAQSEKKFCPYCGNAIEEAYTYCVFCGRKIN